MDKNLTSLRLLKQCKNLEKEPIPGVIVKRDGHLNFHFCLHDLQEDYQGGVYHGLLELHENYPFAPPKLKFFTPSGRFQPEQYICTSFTNYHKETWSAVWNVKSLITATISFLHSPEYGKGGMISEPAIKQELAKKSLQNNMKNQKFVQLFAEDLKKLGILKTEEKQDKNEEKQPLEESESELISKNNTEDNEELNRIRETRPKADEFQIPPKKKIHLNEELENEEGTSNQSTVKVQKKQTEKPLQTTQEPLSLEFSNSNKK